MIKILIDRHIADLRAYQQKRIQYIEKNLEQNNIAKQIKVHILLNFFEFPYFLEHFENKHTREEFFLKLSLQYHYHEKFRHLSFQIFISNHKKWVHARKQMSNYAVLQHKVRKTVPFKRSSATRSLFLFFYS